MVTWPSPAITTFSPCRTERIVVPWNRAESPQGEEDRESRALMPSPVGGTRRATGETGTLPHDGRLARGRQSGGWGGEGTTAKRSRKAAKEAKNAKNYRISRRGAMAQRTGRQELQDFTQRRQGGKERKELP